jgi:hypothetical protein
MKRSCSFPPRPSRGQFHDFCLIILKEDLERVWNARDSFREECKLMQKMRKCKPNVLIGLLFQKLHAARFSHAPHGSVRPALGRPRDQGAGAVVKDSRVRPGGSVIVNAGRNQCPSGDVQETQVAVTYVPEANWRDRFLN